MGKFQEKKRKKEEEIKEETQKEERIRKICMEGREKTTKKGRRELKEKRGN